MEAKKHSKVNRDLVWSSLVKIRPFLNVTQEGVLPSHNCQSNKKSLHARNTSQSVFYFAIFKLTIVMAMWWLSST